LIEQIGFRKKVAGGACLASQFLTARDVGHEFGDELQVFLKLSRCNEDASRWSMLHELWINGDTLAAVITIDGAWIDTKIRKLAPPPGVCKTGFDLIPKTAGFNQ
jgi:acyl-CoA thioester hydrolase